MNSNRYGPIRNSSKRGNGWIVFGVLFLLAIIGVILAIVKPWQKKPDIKPCTPTTSVVGAISYTLNEDSNTCVANTCNVISGYTSQAVDNICLPDSDHIQFATLADNESCTHKKTTSGISRCYLQWVTDNPYDSKTANDDDYQSQVCKSGVATLCKSGTKRVGTGGDHYYCGSDVDCETSA